MQRQCDRYRFTAHLSYMLCGQEDYYGISAKGMFVTRYSRGDGYVSNALKSALERCGGTSRNSFYEIFMTRAFVVSVSSISKLNPRYQ